MPPPPTNEANNMDKRSISGRHYQHQHSTPARTDAGTVIDTKTQEEIMETVAEVSPAVNSAIVPAWATIPAAVIIAPPCLTATTTDYYAAAGSAS